METCKECEHYEFYDGPELTSYDEKAIMFCPKLKGNGATGYSCNTSLCHIDGNFTPKKPKEEPEKDCEICNRNSMNARTCPTNTDVINGKPDCINKDLWQPIPDKPQQPEEKTKQEYEAYINLLNSRLKEQAKSTKSEKAELKLLRKRFLNTVATISPEEKDAREQAEYNRRSAAEIRKQDYEARINLLNRIKEHYRIKETVMVFPLNDEPKMPSTPQLEEIARLTDTICKPKPPKHKENKMVTCADCNSYTKYEGEEKDYWSGKTAIMSCDNSKMQTFCSSTDINECKYFKPKTKSIPIHKENKMIGKLLFSVRRIVLGCTVYCFVKMSIFLNPLVFRTAKMIRTNYGLEGGSWESVYKNGEFLRREYVESVIPWNSGDYGQIAFVWSTVLAACALIVLTICAYNRVTALLFGEK